MVLFACYCCFVSGSTSPPFVPVSVKISRFRWYQSDPFYNNDGNDYDDDGDDDNDNEDHDSGS